MLTLPPHAKKRFHTRRHDGSVRQKHTKLQLLFVLINDHIYGTGSGGASLYLVSSNVVLDSPYHAFFHSSLGAQGEPTIPFFGWMFFFTSSFFFVCFWSFFCFLFSLRPLLPQICCIFWVMERGTPKHNMTEFVSWMPLINELLHVKKSITKKTRDVGWFQPNRVVLSFVWRL